MLRPEGLPFIFTGASLGCLGGSAVAFGHPAGWALAALGAAGAGFCAYFFRDPERPLPQDPSLIYSPGDGRVLTVAREGPGDVTTVRIFLSVFDVHVQRFPYWGTVETVRHQPGAFKMAMADEARENERVVVAFAAAGRNERLVVEQIAGYVARRIRCWLKPGDQVPAGARYGLIQFGSQAAVHLPASAEPVVKPGDRVAGGLTPIARWRTPA